MGSSWISFEGEPQESPLLHLTLWSVSCDYRKMAGAPPTEQGPAAAGWRPVSAWPPVIKQGLSIWMSLMPEPRPRESEGPGCSVMGQKGSQYHEAANRALMLEKHLVKGELY